MLWSMHHKFYIVTFTLFTRIDLPSKDVKMFGVSWTSNSVCELFKALLAYSRKEYWKKEFACASSKKWCKCKCYSVGRCESNSSQLRCCRPFSVMKIGFLVDMILLVTKSCDRATVMQIEMVKKWPGLKNHVYTHDNW